MCVVAKRMLEDICPTSCVLLRNMDVWRHRVGVLLHGSPRQPRHPLKLYQTEVAMKHIRAGANGQSADANAENSINDEEFSVYVFPELKFEAEFFEEPDYSETGAPFGVSVILIKDPISAVSITESPEQYLRNYYQATEENAKRELQSNLVYKLKHGGLSDLDRRTLKLASKDIRFRNSNGIPIAYTVFPISESRRKPPSLYGYYSLGILGLSYYCAYGMRRNELEATNAIERFNFLP